MTVTIDVSQATSSGYQLEDTFSSDLDATIVDGTGSGLDNADDSSVFFNQISPTDSATLTYEVTVPSGASDGTTYDFSGTLTTPDGDTAVSGDSTLTVDTEADPGPDPEPEPGAEYSLSELNDHPIVWQGQTLEVTGISDGTAQVWQSDGQDPNAINLESNEQVSNDGTLSLETDNLEAGNWYFVRTDGDDWGSFLVSEQTVDFQLDASSVQADGGTSLVFADDNRGESVDVIISAESLDADALTDVFTGASVESEDDGTVRVEGLSEGDSTPVDAASLDPGNYNFTVEVADTTASDSVSLEVTEVGERFADFTEGVYNEQVGDVASFGVDTTGMSEVYVVVEDEHGVLDHTFSASDIDESADVSLNTFNTLQDPQAALSTSTDGVSLSEVADDSDDVDAQLEPSRVNLRLYDGNPESGGTQMDRAILRLEDNALMGATTWTAPADADPSADISDLTSGATQRSDVANGDYLITQFEASGIHGYLMEDGEFAPDANADLSLTFSDTADPGPYTESDSWTLESGDDVSSMDGIWIRQDAASNQFFVVVDPAAFPASGLLDTGETWNVEFAMGTGNPYNGGDDPITNATTFDFTERSISLDVPENADGDIVLPNSSSASVTGSATMAPGTEISVTSFFATEILDASAEVGEGGSWSVEMDLSSYTHGEDFTLQASETGIPLSGVSAADTGEVSGVTGDQPADPDAEAEFELDASAPSNVALNGQAQIAYQVHNTGGLAGDVSWTIFVDGEEVDDGSATLGAGESTAPAGYALPTDVSGDVSWSVSTNQGQSRDGTLYVRPEDPEPDEANFQLFASAPEEVTVGQSAAIEFSLTNTGGQSGSVDYTVTVDGSEATSNSVTLGPDESTDTLRWTLPTTEDGDVSWEVSAGDATRSGSLTVQPEPEPPDPNDSDDDDGGGGGGQPGFGLVVALFALIGAALLALRRQN